MEVSSQDISRHYASLSDAEMLSIEADDLTNVARKCYEREMERRQLISETRQAEAPREVNTHSEMRPDWIDTAASACAFQVGDGRRYSEDAERACEVLRDAGIPSEVVGEHNDDGSPDVISVMVPGPLSLKAASILDRDLFNDELEETWRTHFDELTDDELFALHPDDLCAGLLDRAARLKRVYEEAVALRRDEDRTR